MNNKRHWLVLGATALVSASLLSGCSSTGSKNTAQSLEAEPPTLAAQDQAPATQAQTQDRPGGLEGELVVITATVKAIDKKNRVVTLQSPDGKVAKVKCGPEVRNFAQIRVGDVVKTSLLETVELFVTGNDEPAAERVTEVGRAPLGNMPGFAAIDAVEVKATVVAIDYQTRKVTLKGPEGKVIKVTAGAQVKRLTEVKVGDSVVARLTRAVSIEVSKPVTN
jgi:outer membrane murein-binding lipoprotein Lpp